MQLLTELLDIQQKIFDYFGYKQDWRILPLDDARDYFWRLEGGETGAVRFAETEEDLQGESEEYYENEIYTQRHLPKWVYRGEEYTMICVDTHTDGNQLLQVFDNAKER